MDVRGLTAAIACALVLVGCSRAGEDASSLPDDATVTYAFHDSSVPPPYHRSVTLTVTQDESRIVVDSYGDVLADEATVTPAQVWATLAETYPAVTGLEAADVTDGCVGGTATDLDVVSGTTTLMSVAASECAGANEAVVAAIDDWIAPARDLFPATDVLAPEGE